MVLASSIAAATAASGSIEKKDNLLLENDCTVSEYGLSEIEKLSLYFKSISNDKSEIKNGIYKLDSLNICIVPGIIIE